MGTEQEQTNRLLSTSSSDTSENENPKTSNEIKSEENLQKSSENTDQTNNIELLGSVIVQNCPGVRTSARVIQKMKQDSVRCTSPPLHDKKDNLKDEKNTQKTSNQSKSTLGSSSSSSLSSSSSTRQMWTNLEKNLFFDALNEYGKDFDAIYNFINSKLKKNSNDQIKTKDQIRHSYYQTFHKISKYIKFSDEVKKPVQELYALINYGEMRRRLAFVSEKNLMKIRELVYKGHVTVRSKGKSIRIKTPSCKALRKLNQLEGWLEDIKLPSKVEVCLRPATMEAWGRVQNLAQNPVIRTVVPLQKRLINIIKTFQYKWRSQDTKMNEAALKLIGTSSSSLTSPSPTTLITSPTSIITSSNDILLKNDNKIETDHQNYYNNEPLICFRPQKDAKIHRPLVSITQYLSSFNICLNSYEERMGIKIRGETLWQERSHTNKRQRTDSGCEKKNSPENKKCRITTPDNNNITMIITSTDIKSSSSNSPTLDIKSEKCFTDNTIENQHINKDYKDDSDDLELGCGNIGGVGGGYNSESDLINELVVCDEQQQQMNNHDHVDNSISNNISGNKNEIIDENGLKIDANNLNSSNSAKINLSISSQLLSSSSSDILNKAKKYNKKKDKDNKKDINNLKPLINNETIKRIRKGWTILNASDITIGDLYIVFGQNSKIMFEYYWLNDKKIEFDINVPYSSTNRNDTVNLLIGRKNSTDKNNIVNKIHNHNLLSNKLKHLLLIANLSERIKRKQCTCGHICGTKNKQSENNEIASKSFVSNVTYSSSSSDVNIFRQPVLPLRRTLAVQSFKQIPNGRIKQSRFLRSGKISSRQIVVQRLLPVQPGVNQSFDVVTPQIEIRTVQDNTNTPTTVTATTTITSATLNRRDLQHNSPTEIQNTQKSISLELNTIRKDLNLSNNNDDDYDYDYDDNDNDNDEIQQQQQQQQYQTVTTISNTNGEDYDIFIPSSSSSLDLQNENLNNNNDNETILEMTRNSDTIPINNDTIITTTSTAIINNKNQDLDSVLSPLLELSLPSPLPLPMSSLDDNTSDALNSIPTMSPMQLLRETSGDSKWLEDNMSDFSLTSFLGHLDEINNREISMDNANISVISESSVDYVSKFAEIASMQNEERDL